MKRSKIYHTTDYNRGMRDGRDFGRQILFDLSCIALNDVFGFGPTRITKYYNRLMELQEEYAQIFNSDSNDMEYSKAIIDRRLEQIAGDKFIPWEKRYG